MFSVIQGIVGKDTELYRRVKDRMESEEDLRKEGQKAIDAMGFNELNWSYSMESLWLRDSVANLKSNAVNLERFMTHDGYEELAKSLSLCNDDSSKRYAKLDGRKKITRDFLAHAWRNPIRGAIYKEHIREFIDAIHSESLADNTNLSVKGGACVEKSKLVTRGDVLYICIVFRGLVDFTGHNGKVFTYLDPTEYFERTEEKHGSH